MQLFIWLHIFDFGLALLATVYMISKSYEPKRDDPQQLPHLGSYAPG